MKLLPLVLVMTICCAHQAVAALVVDQEYDVRSSSGSINYYLDYPGDYFQQTFTVRNTGVLMGVGVQVSLDGHPVAPSYDPIDDLHLRILRVGADGLGIPDQVLAEATIKPASLPTTLGARPGDITDIDLSLQHVQVTAGQQLSIQLFSEQTANSGPEPGTNYMWFQGVFNPHQGGEFSIFSPQIFGDTPLRALWLVNGNQTIDGGFRVYVDTIPEPNSMVLISYFIAIAATRRRGPMVRAAFRPASAG